MSNFKSNGVDLNAIFKPYSGGEKASTTHFKTADGKDLNERFQKYTSGTKAIPTGFKVDKTDLCDIFEVVLPSSITAYKYDNASQPHRFKPESVRCVIAAYGAKNNHVGINTHHGSFSLIDLKIDNTFNGFFLGVSIEKHAYGGDYANHAWFSIVGLIPQTIPHNYTPPAHYPVTGLQLLDRTYSIDIYNDKITPTNTTKTNPNIRSIIHEPGTDAKHGYIIYRQNNQSITEFENQTDNDAGVSEVSGTVVIYEYSSS